MTSLLPTNLTFQTLRIVIVDLGIFFVFDSLPTRTQQQQQQQLCRNSINELGGGNHIYYGKANPLRPPPSSPQPAADLIDFFMIIIIFLSSFLFGLEFRFRGARIYLGQGFFLVFECVDARGFLYLEVVCEFDGKMQLNGADCARYLGIANETCIKLHYRNLGRMKLIDFGGGGGLGKNCTQLAHKMPHPHWSRLSAQNMIR